jgi:hypothetical protein
MKMKYKVGDKVKIVKERTSCMNTSGKMDKYLGTVMTIKEVYDFRYYMEEDEGRWAWDDNDIEGYAEKIEVGDIVKLNKKAKIEDFTKNYWNGCQISTLDFIKNYWNDEEFIVEDVNDRWAKLEGLLVNINILILVKKSKKEMTIAEIEKELGYPIKIIK